METKKWYQSKTIWGLVVALIGFVLNNALQVELDLPANADLGTIQEHIKQIKESNGVNNIVAQVMAFAGTLFAIYGRVKADTSIK
jgi:hypothetical protein